MRTGERGLTSRPILAAGALVVLTAAAPLAAQEVHPFTAPPPHTIDQWTTEDGLPQNSVNAIVQTSDGYLWLGTFGGLVRFDGTRFTLMERTDSAGRHIDRVLALAMAPDGSLWIGTQNEGLLRLKNGVYEKFTSGDGALRGIIVALHVSGGGDLWIGADQSVIVRYADGRYRRFHQADGLSVGRVVTFTEDRDGTLWISTTNGFFTVDDGGLRTVRPGTAALAGAEYLALVDEAGAKWFTLPGRMAREADGVVRIFDVPDGSLMVEDPVNGYWIGTGNDGLFYVRPEATGDDRVRRYAQPDGQRAFRVRSQHVDRAGNVWVGTGANGLLRVKRNLFTTYATEHGLSHNVATAVFQATGGALWVATNCGGVNAIDLRSRTLRVYNPRMPDDPEGDPCVFSLAESPEGTLWQGSWGGGVSLLTSDREDLPAKVAGLPDSAVLALFGDRDGTLWVGMNSGGLAAVEDGHVRDIYTTADGIAHNSVRTIRQTRDGDFWIGTLGGLSRLRDGRFTTFTAADGLSSEHVRAIYEDGQGQLWIGTYGGGLNRFANGTFTPIGREDGLADNVVSSILEDDSGHLWMSGNRGIFRVAMDELNAFADGELDRVHSVLYGTEDGLLTAETNGGFQPAAWKDTQGRLWFPTVEGVTVVDPADVVASERAPSVAIEAVVVDGELRSPDEAIVVGPGRPNVQFRYSGLNLTAPEHVSFQYRLEDFEEDWIQAGQRRVAYYPRLQPGRYRFAVRAANRYGVWSDAGAALSVRVVPLFWNTWSFRLAGVAILLSLLLVVLRRRQTIARREREARENFSRRLIEGQEHERKRIAGALHDGLGQQLLVIRNRALLALRSDGKSEAAREQIRQISDLAAESLADVRNVAHDLTPHELDHLGVTAALKTMVDVIGQSTEIHIREEVEDIDGLLPVEREINLYRVVQEALNNMVRHSRAETAAVRVRRRGMLILLSIEDDGTGFSMVPDSSAPPTGRFGLSGMAERVRILGGRIEIDSAPGSGTRISVSVPVASAEGARTASSRGGRDA